jgi:hypothetical protein
MAELWVVQGVSKVARRVFGGGMKGFKVMYKIACLEGFLFLEGQDILMVLWGKRPGLNRLKKARPPLRKRILKMEEKAAARAVSRINRIMALEPVERSNLQAYFEKRGLNEGLEVLGDECLALVNNVLQVEKGLSPSFAISRRDEATVLRRANKFLRLLKDAEDLGLI